MNCTGILSLVFLFATTRAIAQQSLTRLRAVGADCPLDMQASHGAGAPIAEPAINGTPMEPWTPNPTLDHRIHLVMINLRSHDIVGAQITAHGFGDKWKAIDLENSSQAPDLAKTLDVVLDVKGMGRASSDLSLSRFTAVTSIDLNSITYADGSIWHTSSAGACRITPDLIMLVAARR
jgi:hypothetical protein